MGLRRKRLRGELGQRLHSPVRVPGPPRLAGAGFSLQRTDAIAAEAWDVPLDAVCTESDTFLVEP